MPEPKEPLLAEQDGISLEQLRSFDAFRLRLTGKSMEPSLPPGTTLRVEPCAPEDLRLGEVAVYRGDGGRLFSHRVLWKRGKEEGMSLFMKGDSLRRADGFIPGPSVLGRAIAEEAGSSGRWGPWLCSLLGWMLYVVYRATPLPRWRRRFGVQHEEME